jgi:hypothetical protein
MDDAERRFTYMAEMRPSFEPTHVERDPVEMYGLPRTLGQWWRLARKIMAYEYRKAAGTLRRYPKPRHAILTGITS